MKIKNNKDTQKGWCLFLSLLLIIATVVVTPFASAQGIEWEVTINFEDLTTGEQDTVVFGEATDAGDGPPPDDYDVPKPGKPPNPYVYAWFDNNLSYPYNKLWMDYREYPETLDKVWNLTLEFNASGPFLGTTDINISWNTDDVNFSEYVSVELWNDTDKLADMKTENNYTLNNADDSITYSFYIKCHVNQAPVVSDIPDQAAVKGGTFVNISLDDYVVDDVDPDSAIVWSYSGNSELTVSINATRVASIGIPDENWVGSETITFQANDTSGLNDSDSATFTVVEKIIINEILYDTPGIDVHCFTELYGPAGTSLTGYSLVGINGANGVVYATIDLSGNTIPDDNYFVIAEDSGVSNYDLIDLNVDWQNGPDSVVLRYGGSDIDAVGYGVSAYFAGEGNPAPDVSEDSLARIPDHNDTDDNSVDFQAAVPTPGIDNVEVIINEILYDTNGTDEHCFTELYGPAGTSLNNYTLVGINGANGDEYATINLSGNTIPDDRYFVIAQDSGVPNYDIINASVDWQNGPDNVVLRFDGAVVDAVGYGVFTSNFYGEGEPAPDVSEASLARIPDHNDTDNNTVDFQAAIPTPGINNIDTTPPDITNIQANPSPQTPGGYVNITCDVTDNNAVDVVKINITDPNGDSINTTMNLGSYHYNDTYTINGTYDYFIWANDTSGNSYVSDIYSFFMFEQIIINEILYDTAGTDVHCFTELYGPAGTNLTGYSLVGINGANGDEYATINLSGNRIPDDNYFVIAQDAGVPRYDIINASVDWQNGPDNVVLRFDGAVVDAVGYGDFVGNFTGEGEPAPDVSVDSLARIPDHSDTDNNTVDFQAAVPTPGVNNTDIILPEISDVQADPVPQTPGGYVNITCNVTDNNAVDFVYVNITDPNGDSINTTMDSGSYYYNNTYTIIGTYDYFIWASDTSGNSNVSSIHSFVIIETIMINEILYDTAGTDVHCFTELYGPAGTSLTGYTLVGINGANGDEYASIDLSGNTIPDDNYFVIAEDSGVSNYDMIDASVDWQNGPDNVVLRFEGTDVDAVGYGVFTSNFAGEGNPAPDVSIDSLARIPDHNDTDDNSVDFQAAVPTPGIDNVEVIINEILYDTSGIDEHCFTELYGPVGTNLTGYTLVGINGADGAEYATIDLSGNTIPGDRYFVIAQDSGVPNYDIIDASVDWQNGPDNVVLRFNGAVVDAVGYGVFASNFNGEGEPAPDVSIDSLARIPDHNDTDNNSVDFQAAIPTPGLNNIDSTPPDITNVIAAPDPQGVGGFVNITCDVTDNNAVDFVKINITDPNGDSINTTMNPGSYHYNNSYTIIGTYDYFIWANDTSGNSYTSSVYHFDIKNLSNISLNSSWNLISIPFNESIPKTDLFVRYNGVNYPWDNATTNNNPTNGPLVGNFFFDWNRTNSIYDVANTLDPGYGYWMWAYYDCTLLVFSNVTYDDNITNLQLNWNIMGLPYNQSIAKQDIIVHYNITDYTWENATGSNNEEGEPLLLKFVYGWNSTEQMYILSDTFESGLGYWMFAYYNVTLLRPIG